MSDLRIAIPELEAWVRRFKSADRIVTEELRKASQKSGLLVERKAKEYAPVWRGHLRRSITSVTETRSLVSTTKVGTNLPYARAVEFGRPAGAKMPPPGALLPWMASKGIPATNESIKGTRRVRDEAGNVVGSIITGRGFVGPRRGYLPNEWAIAKAIQKNIKKRPYLHKAFEELKPQIRREFADVPKRVVARLRGTA